MLSVIIKLKKRIILNADCYLNNSGSFILDFSFSIFVIRIDQHYLNKQTIAEGTPASIVALGYPN